MNKLFCSYRRSFNFQHPNAVSEYIPDSFASKGLVCVERGTLEFAYSRELHNGLPYTRFSKMVRTAL